jgi:kojibiose phosphorylase
VSLIEEAWSLREPAHDPSAAGLAETLLCLANGSLGVRQALDHEASDASPGAFHEAVYDRALAVRTAIVNLPAPTPVLAGPAGAPLGALRLESASRSLSLREGVLASEVVMAAEDGRVRIDAKTLVHLEQPDLLLTWGTVTALEGGSAIRVAHGFDWRFGNSYMGGHTPEIVTHNVALSRTEYLDGGGIALEGETVGTGARLAAAARLTLGEPARASSLRERRRILEGLELEVPLGTPVPFTRFCVIVGSPPDGPPPPSPERRLEALAKLGAEELATSHRRAWAQHWKDADVVIEGDERAQSTLRFGSFHLRQAVDRRGTGPAHIPARGLTSEYHSGHTFFNTEFFKLPYWTYVDPSVARRLLLFRHAGLEAARRHAAEAGRAGARYPEETDRDGEPAAPWRIWDLRSGEVAYEWSGREKQFLSAAVAWGVRCYAEATDDVEFLASHGLEMLADVAQYAESLMEWDEGAGAFRVRSVMGGDEYHYHVDDNHLTNHLLAWSMRYAAESVESLAASHPAAVERACGSAALERAAEWRRRAELTYFPPPAANGALQQHEGYFDMPDQTVEALDPNGRPLLSARDRAAADLLEPLQSRLVKEADVILLLALFPEAFNERTRRASYELYAPRTVHESSLSAAPYGVVAAQLGELDDAHKFFLLSGRYDLDFLPRQGFRNGLHLAAYAGAWQVAVQGFAGFRCREGMPVLEPRLPEGWKRLSFALCWRGERVRVVVEGDDVELWFDRDGEGAAQEWLVNGERRRVTAGRLREAA